MPVAVTIIAMVAVSCSGSEGANGPSALLGGETTREDATQNAFGLPISGLSNEERRVFESGDSFFTNNWVTAPASTDARDGLGPTFNAQACSSCHLLDGRGAPPDPTGEEANLGLLFRLSIPGIDAETGDVVPEPTYGGQLQDNSVLSVTAEGTMAVDYESIVGTYGDGTEYELRAPTYTIDDLGFGALHPETMIGPRLAPQVFGVGLLEEVPDETLLSLADPDDADGDGISGRVNMVWDLRRQETVIGRFGWKANVATVEQQVAGAFHGDIGVTSVLHPEENCGSTQQACTQAPNGNDDDGELELTEARLASTTFYNQTLAVPAARNVEDADVIAGYQLFNDFGCSSCHVETLQTGVSSISVLSEQTFHAYTDLLLHDMGEELADGRPDFEATGSEWRTPPLWGIGLVDDINGERFLLHDGRATTLEESILWHGGEGEASREAFRLADAEERRLLILFLEAI